MSALEQIVVTGCPTCGAPAQAIAEGEGVWYRHVDLRQATNTRGVSEAMVAELIAAGDFLAMNGTDGMVRRWERAKAALSAEPAERVPEGLKLAIAHIQQKADAYAEEHCGVEWDTGATTYHHGQAGEDYHHGLLELVDELTQLAATPAAPADGDGKEVSRG